MHDAQSSEPGNLPFVDAATDATVVVLDRDAQQDESVVAQAAVLHERGLRVRTLTGFYEEWLGKLPIAELERASMLFDIGEVHRARYARTKRLMDLAFGALGLLPLVVVVPLVAIANLAGSRGPLLSRQERVGKGGRLFTIVKLRTIQPTSGHEPVNEWTSAATAGFPPVERLLRQPTPGELPTN